MNENSVKALPVVLHPHQVLNQRALPVAAVNEDIRQTLRRMLATMYAAEGVGLAANQVSILQRLVVMDLGVEGNDGQRDHSQKRPKFLVNPEIVWRSEDTITWQEGCLSLPGLYADVVRAAKVRVRFTDYDGKPQEEEAEGLYSVCLQHEIDHLDGILFPQRMSKLRREMAEKKYVRKRKDFLAEPHYDALTAEGGVVAAVPVHPHPEAL